MNYFIYNRKSQEDEGRQVQSIEDQDKGNILLAAQLGATIRADFKEAKSAKRPGRPLFTQMLDRIEAGEVQGLLAWHPDRLSRNAVDAGRIIDLLDRGLLKDLKFQTHTFENTPEGKWMLGIVLGQAKYQNDKLSVDVSRGIRSKLEKGQPPRRAIPGYVNNKADHTYEDDPERFPMIQRAIRLILHRTHTPRQALKVLNTQWGFLTRRTEKTGGKPLSATSWYDMLSNPVITGQFLHDGVLYSGRHSAMLGQHEFETLQQILGKAVARPRAHHFEFNGFIRCGVCGCQVLGEKKVKWYKTTGHRKEYNYYHCSGRRGCSRRSVSPEYIAGEILTLLSKIALHPTVATWCLAPARRFHQQEAGFQQAAYENLFQTLTGLQRKKSNLLDLRLSDPDAMTTEEFKAENGRLQQEINAIQYEIKRAEETYRQLEETVTNIFDFAVNAERLFGEGDSSTRKRIAQLLGVEYVLTLERLEIKPHPLLVPILMFEPPENSSGSQQTRGSDDEFSGWLGLPELIRTLILETRLDFPPLVYTEILHKK